MAVSLIPNPNRLRSALPMPQARDPDVEAWYHLQTDKDAVYYVRAVDVLVRRGRAHGWYPRLSELWLGGSKNLNNNLNGLKGVRLASDLTIVNGGITAQKAKGVAGDPLLKGYIDTGLLPTAYPGVTQNDHSLCAYISSNEVGSFQIAGASGTGGFQSFMLRCGGLFRGGFWSAAPQVIFGGPIAVGFRGFSRSSATEGFSIAAGIRVNFQLSSQSMPNNNFTLCSAEPGTGNSPQRWIMISLGASLTEEQADAFEEDMDEFVRNIGLYDEIQVPPDPLGPSCFDKNSYQLLVPSDQRIFRQAMAPATNNIDGGAYPFFPITDTMARSVTQSIRPVELGASPLTTTNGSTTLTVEDIEHGALVEDIVKLIGAPGSTVRGIPVAQINTWHRIDEIVDENHYNVIVTTPATSGGTGGGSAMTINMVQLKPLESTFTHPRNGVHWYWPMWSNRGERNGDDDTVPVDTTSIKPNDCFPTFNRGTNGFVGVQCRPAYKTKRRAMGATLVKLAFLVGYAARNELSDPLGRGYLDIAEDYDLDPDKVKPWNYFAVNRETIFTVPLAGFAVCYDYVILDHLPMTYVKDIFPRVGICMDQEHADGRPPDEFEAGFNRWVEIGDAKGFEMGFLGHHLNGAVAEIQGWTSGPGGNAPRIVNNPKLRFFNIISSYQTTPPGIIASLDAQLEFVKDGDGNYPAEKILLSCTTGLGGAQVSLVDCALVTEWATAHGVTTKHLRRSAQREGGDETRFWNQQLMEYLPDLVPSAPIDPDGVVTAWISSLADEGSSVTADMQSLRSTLVTGLIDDDVWNNIDLLLLTGETVEQMLKCLRRRTNAVRHGSPLPVFSPNLGMVFDGTQNYLLAGFTPSVDAISITGLDQGLAVYEGTNVGTADSVSAGCADNMTAKNLELRNRDNANLISGRANSALGTAANTDSRRLHYIQQSGLVWSLGKDGAEIGQFIPATSGTALCTRELAIGARNNNGTIDRFRANDVRAVVVFSGLDATKQMALNTRLTAYLTAIGADV